MTYGAVIIETRHIEDLPFTIAEHMSYLPDTWGLTIFHGKSNGDMLKQHFPDAVFIDLDCETLSYHDINNLMTSKDFWNKIQYDKILMFHHDSKILRQGIEEFLEWDYIGAPWISNERGGNGALSIRDKNAILRLIDFLPYEGYEWHDNEDRWISNNLHLIGGKVAPRDICFKFSCETIFNLGTFGFHAIDKYLSEEECNSIKNQYIDGKVTIYVLTYNEEFFLPYMISFYRNRFPNCRIVLYDNQSTDNTVKIAIEMGCEVETYITNNKLDDFKYQEIKNNCWKNAKTDWVIICDCDELLDIDRTQLIEEEKLGSTIIRSEAYHMVNLNNNLDIDSIKHGVREIDNSYNPPVCPYDKHLLFNKRKLREIGYTIGAHFSNPIGRVKYSDIKYKLYHYRYINPDHLVARYKLYAKRKSQLNNQHGLGWQYDLSSNKIKAQFKKYRKLAVKVR